MRVERQIASVTIDERHSSVRLNAASSCLIIDAQTRAEIIRTSAEVRS
jgi:hypothetical protein